MKCTVDKCNKPAEYVLNGNSVCKDHGPKEEQQEGQGQTMADRMVGKF